MARRVAVGIPLPRPLEGPDRCRCCRRADPAYIGESGSTWSPPGAMRVSRPGPEVECSVLLSPRFRLLSLPQAKPWHAAVCCGGEPLHAILCRAKTPSSADYVVADLAEAVRPILGVT
jgi:hypothetical protein